MKFSIISGVAVAALALGTVAAYPQTTITPGGGYNPTFKPPPDVYNNSTIGPASSDQSASSQYTQGVKAPPDVYNDSTIGPARANESRPGQYTQGSSLSLVPSSTAGLAEQTGPTQTKSR